MVWSYPAREQDDSACQLLIRENIPASKVHIDLWGHIIKANKEINKKSMKKLIKRFWGVGLVIMILSSLFVVAPASADDNEWVATSAPSTATFVRAVGSDLADIAVQ